MTTRRSHPRRALACACESLEMRRMLCSLPGHHDEPSTWWMDYEANAGPVAATAAAPVIAAPATAAPVAASSASAKGGGGGGGDIGPGTHLGAATNLKWTNRGTTGDRFSDVFGSNAGTARAVVDQALLDWEETLTDLGTVNISISMDSSGEGTGGGAAVDLYLGGGPAYAHITLARGEDTNFDGLGDGAGWFLDPTPEEHSEFLGPITNAFAGTTQSGSPASGLSDLYTVVVTELAHCMGLETGHLTAYTTDTGQTDNAEGGGTGTFWIFDGPSVEHLMTSNNGGPASDGGTDRGNALHTAGPTANISFASKTWIGADDNGNAVYTDSERYLVSNVVTLILKDSFGYTIDLPEHRGSFYAVLDSSTGIIHVRGGTDGANSADNIVIEHSGSTTTISVDVGQDVPGSGEFAGSGDLDAFVTKFADSDFSSIQIDAGDGDDTIRINGLTSSTPVTINGDDGNDTISFSSDDHILSHIDSDVSIDGGAGTDRINFYDSGSVAGNFYDVYADSFERIGTGWTASWSSVERLNVEGDDADSSFNVFGTDSGVLTTLSGSGGDDTFFFSPAAYDLDDFDGAVTVNGDGGDDDVWMLDTTSASAHTYTVTNTTFDRGGFSHLYYSAIAQLRVYAGSGDDTINVNTVASYTAVTVHGGSGDDTVTLAADSGNMDDIDSDVNVYGDGGTDGLVLDDSSQAGTYTHTITSSTYDRSAFPLVTYYTLESLKLNGGPGTGTFNVESTDSGVSTTVNGGDGNDVFNVAPTSSNLSSIDGALTLDGKADDDTLNVVDQPAFGFFSYAIDSTTLTRSQILPVGSVSITFASMYCLNLTSGSLGSTFSVQDTPAAMTTTINAGGGNDTIKLAPATQNIGDVQGPVVVNGEAGTDSIVLDDTNASVGNTYTLTSTQITRGLFGGLTYATAESISLAGGALADTFNAKTTLSTTPISITAGAGADVLNLGNASVVSGIASAVTFAGGTGADVITLDDTAATLVGSGFVITASAISRGASTFVNYSEAEALTVSSSGGLPKSHTISSTSAATTLNTGSGSDMTLVGAGNLDNLAGAVTVNGDGGMDTLFVLDSASTSDNTYVLETTTLRRITASLITYSQIFGINLTAGSGNDSIHIDSLLPITPATVFGGNGDDVFHDALSTLDMTFVPAMLLLSGDGGTDALALHDTSETSGHSYVIQSNQITRSGAGTIAYGTMESINLTSGSGNSSINVESNPVNCPVTVDAGPGTDAIAVAGTSHDLDNVHSDVIINGQAGTDSLTIHDESDGANSTYDLTSTTLDRTLFPLLTYGSVESLELSSGDGNNTYNIASTAAATPVTINAGPANDAFNVTGATSSTLNVNGEAPVIGPGDTLYVAGGGGSGIYIPSGTTFGSGMLSVFGQTINFTSLEPVKVTGFAEFTLVTPNGRDILTVDSPSQGYNRVSGSSGNVGFENIAFSNVGVFTIDAGSHDSAGNDADNILITSQGLSATGLGVLRIRANSGTNSVVVAGGNAILDAGPAGGPANVTLDVNGSANVTFPESQRLAALRINGPGTVSLGPTASSLHVNDLILAGPPAAPQGTLDLHSGNLVVEAGASILPKISQWINAGRNGQDANIITRWNGKGIRSAAARDKNVAAGFDLTSLGVLHNSDLANPSIGRLPYAAFSSQPIGLDALIVKFTYSGDADLNGFVDGDDYALIDNAFNGLIPNFGWMSGDLNGDSMIDGDDYALIDSGFLFQQAPIL